MIRELKTLQAVAREGTFAAAGAKVGLTQAAVSAQMQRLEQAMGFTLFDRVGRTARLNSRGQQLLPQAQELLDLYGNLGVAATGQGAGVRLSVGAIASLQRVLLPAALAGFLRQRPGCSTHIVPGVSMALVNQVDAGELDMAAVIRPPFTLQGDLRWKTLAREPFRLIVPRHLPGDDWVELLSTQPFIRYDRASYGGRLVDSFLRRQELPLREVAEADELDAIVKLVALGVGVALVPQGAVWRRWPAAVRALDLGDQTFHREVGLVHRALRHLSEPARCLVALIQAEAAGLARAPL